MSLPHETDSFFDNTRLSAYKDCPRKYFLRHVMHWRGEGIATPLAFGGAWHAAMDIVWKYGATLTPDELQTAAMANFLEKWTEEGLPAELDVDQTQAYTPRTPSIAAEMVANYIEDRARYLQGSEVIAVEQPFAVPLPNMPATWYVGRLDKMIGWQGQTLALEHKTTALYRKEGYFPMDWVQSWYNDAQVKGYEYGAGLYYPKFDGVWIDGALCHKTVHNGFKFIPVHHSVDLVVEWLHDAEQWVERINRDTILFEQYGHLAPGTFPKNENSCFGKYGVCPYLDVCRTRADVDKGEAPPIGYIVEVWNPFETLGLSEIIHAEEATTAIPA